MTAITRDIAHDIAAQFGFDENMVLALTEVESSGEGYLPDGRPKILFEAHIFSMKTGHKYDVSHPDISSRYRNPALYKGGAAEWNRLEKAALLDDDAAFESASWGTFQIMGFNYRQAGFDKVDDMAAAMFGPIGNHVKAFISFCSGDPALVEAIKDLDFDEVARIYNGPGAIRVYSPKLEEAYKRYAAQQGR